MYSYSIYIPVDENKNQFQKNEIAGDKKVHKKLEIKKYGSSKSHKCYWKIKINAKAFAIPILIAVKSVYLIVVRIGVANV